ncbi:MAG: hypothetical protein K6F86_04065 [Lachnospiraceae bacterium]|nr:hypothetical protein [Lachnospiraceae bacterium]
MPVLNCRKCNKIFSTLAGFNTVCPECRKKDEEDFKRVKSFVWDHPGVTVDEAAEICNVSPKDIKEWLREERLSLADGSVADFLTCDRCGKPILKGRFCEKCKADMVTDLKHATEKPKMSGALVTPREPGEDEKMRFLGREKR